SGHGHGDNGACATIGGKTNKEATETITMVKKIKKQLADYDVNVTLYDTTKNAYEVLCKGGKIDFTKYDYVLEVHLNSCVRDFKGDGKTTGTEILLPTRNTPKDTTLEKQILKNIATLGLRNRGTKTQSIMTINTASLQGTKASLLEICFIDDKDDMDIYLLGKDKIAKQIANAFVKVWDLHKVTTTTAKVAFRSAKKVTPENRIAWIPKGTNIVVLKEDGKWLQINYKNKVGWIVRSKTSM
ncbi:MAG: N-acetylmuramoyl-L-alanine amidase, partial [Ruminococcus flavefaciens]|nr:N-acetylmuramoyl-L-alanine amidase [Ruminococcus flavefaciens]